MKSVFDKITREDLVTRISALNENNKAQWGKMTLSQMIRHCILCEEMYQGKTTYKRAFIGRLFGKTGLKSLLKDESPIKRNSPTSPHFIIKETTGNIPSEKDKWISLIKEYDQYPNNDFEHWFFGKMTKEQVGYFVYKHTDHHLRQFNQ